MSSTNLISGKKRALEESDDNLMMKVDDTTEGSSSDNHTTLYEPLPFYGEHKRAVSSVQLAPSKLTKSNDSTTTIRNWNVLAASASADGLVKVWDLRHQNNTSLLQPHLTCSGHARGINQVCWNPLSPLLATASDDKTLRIWDAVAGGDSSLLELKGHTSFVFAVDQSHNMVVSGSFDETVKLWDLRSGVCTQTLPAHSDPVTAVSFNRDGTIVASASHDGLIRLWDVATGECLKTLYAAGNPPVSALTFAPSGKYVLAGTLDSTWRLWPVTQTSLRRCCKTYAGDHVNTKYSILADFTADGKAVVTGSEDGNIVFYDLQTKKVKQVLEKAHKDAVLALSTHDKLPLLCSGGMTEDRKVQFWASKELKEMSA